MPIALPPLQLLELSGHDAVAFAHAQFASDVRALAVGHWQWSSWLSPQGRVRALFRLLRTDDDRFLAVTTVSTAPLRDALSRYVLRSKVQLRSSAATWAWGCFDAAEIPAGTAASIDRFARTREATVIPAPNGAATRWLVFGEDSPAPDRPGLHYQTVERWQAADIEGGIVTLTEQQSERYLPAWLGLERLGAVSLGKGCYPGQEIVARMHFRGGNKRWLYRLAFTADALPLPGIALQAADAGIEGELVCAAWTDAPHGLALAVLPMVAAGGELTAPGTPATFRVVCAVHAASG